MLERFHRTLPSPAPAFMIFATIVTLGLLLAFGGLSVAPWLAYCCGLVCGVAISSLLATYFLIWVANLDDGADAHHFRRHRE